MNAFSCPSMLVDKEVITLAHGGGGKQTAQLIDEVFLPAFRNDQLELLHDGACVSLAGSKLIFTTDSYVIQPIFFPGGDIGKLAITGTINDIAMCGGSPCFISCAFIIEEGFFQEDLKKIVKSMQHEAEAQHVKIVTGDTKVIERQQGGNLATAHKIETKKVAAPSRPVSGVGPPDTSSQPYEQLRNLFINTTGIGVPLVDYPINPLQIRAGDCIILSGDIGRHGIAVMAEREGLEFSVPLISDVAPLNKSIEALLKTGIEVHCLRDLTRGGLATALVETAEVSKMNFLLHEQRIPISEAVDHASEILGLDPLYIANEGRFIAFIPENDAQKAIMLLKKHPVGEGAIIIGQVEEAGATGKVLLKSLFGTSRYLFKLSGDQLPRIC